MIGSVWTPVVLTTKTNSPTRTRFLSVKQRWQWMRHWRRWGQTVCDPCVWPQLSGSSSLWVFHTGVTSRPDATTLVGNTFPTVSERGTAGRANTRLHSLCFLREDECEAFNLKTCCVLLLLFSCAQVSHQLSLPHQRSCRWSSSARNVAMVTSINRHKTAKLFRSATVF